MSISDDTGLLVDNEAVPLGGGEPAVWAEGPVWIPARRAVRYSDIPNDRILEWSEETGRVSVYATGVEFTNGRIFAVIEHSIPDGIRRRTRQRVEHRPGRSARVQPRRHPDLSHPGPPEGRQPVLRRHRRQDPVHDRHHPALPDSRPTCETPRTCCGSRQPGTSEPQSAARDRDAAGRFTDGTPDSPSLPRDATTRPATGM